MSDKTDQKTDVASDPQIDRFIKDSCVLGKFHRTRLADLFAEYVRWAEKRGEPTLRKIAFGWAMGESARPIFAMKSGGVRYWVGIGLIGSGR